MKVKELISLLEKENQEAEVMLAFDDYGRDSFVRFIANGIKDKDDKYYLPLDDSGDNIYENGKVVRKPLEEITGDYEDYIMLFPL